MVRCSTWEGFDPLLLWWLSLFIEALVLFPNSGKGANNGNFERGQLVKLSSLKVVFAYQRLW